MCQPDLRTNHSTDYCPAQLIDFLLTGMDKQMHTNMILLDLQRAFGILTGLGVTRSDGPHLHYHLYKSRKRRLSLTLR